jgi:nucleoside-diphosphate-sugar epimerase
VATSPRSGSARVLVTGAGGFIGRHLVADQLARGREVVALDLHLDALTPLASERLRLLPGDVGDRDTVARALEGVGVVFHLAAAHLSVSAAETEFRRVNVEALEHLVRACADAGIDRFVHCSTVGVYGVLQTLPADEETACRPEFAYEVTKLEGERVLLEAHRSSAFPVVVLRPVWVYGPGCPRTEKLFRAIARGRFIVAGRGRSMRHSVYIRDMVEAFELAAHAPAAVGETVVVGDAAATTVRELVDGIARLTGAAAPHAVPAWLLWLAGVAAEACFAPFGKEPPVSRRTLRFFSGNTSFRTEKARRVLGFSPRYSLRSGLAETHRVLQDGHFWAVPLPEPEVAG